MFSLSKGYFPAIWFGLLIFFVAFDIISGNTNLFIYVVPIAMAVVGFSQLANQLMYII